jgi:methylated-DNA-[protein]-cysteine S-methyltransferase
VPGATISAVGQTLYTIVASPIDDLLLTGDGQSVTRLWMRPLDGGEWSIDRGWRRDDRAFADAKTQLDAYFGGGLREFDLPLAPAGTPFQRAVWDLLLRIPFGRTATYGELARELGKPDASRAVGLANGRNPISIVVPCHRVIGSSGALTGYGGGLPRKAWLLAHERAAVGQMALI